MNYVAIVAYDGFAYFGWQKTREGPSIEETLEKTLTQIFQHPISLQAASRTDRGVHAEGQIINWNSSKHIDCNRLHISINQLLPSDIQILSLTTKDECFHPTLDNTGKHYVYSITTGAVQLPSKRHTHWHIVKPLNIESMRNAARELIGTHDFKPFCNFRKNLKYESTICTLSAITIEEVDNEILIHMIGNRFLYKMARNIAGSLVYVGMGKLTSLSADNRTALGCTAPAHGLCLKKVFCEK